MSATVFLLRIGGLVSSTGEELVFATAAYAGNGTETVIVGADVGTISENALAPLDAIAASGALTVALTYGPALVPLLRRDLLWPGAGTAPPRLAAPVNPSDVVITLDTLGLSTPQLIWIGGEVMRLTGTIGSDYTVNRGVGALGVPRAHYWNEGEDQPPVVLSRQPSPRGARAVVYQSVDGGPETVVYRGMIQAVTVDGSTVALRIGSVLQALRDRPSSPYVLPLADGALTVKVDLEDRIAYGDFACRSQWEPDYIRVWCDDLWFVCVPTRPSWADFGLVGVLSPILQWGKADVAYPPEVNPGFAGQGAIDDTVTLVEGLFSTGLGTPSQTLTAMLTGQWPPGQVCGLDSDDIGDLSALDTAYGGGDLRPFASSDPDSWWPGTDTESKTLGAMIGRGMIEPLGCAITTDSIGRITVVDWTRALGGEELVTGSQLTGRAQRIEETSPVRQVIWRDTRALSDATVVFRSDFATQIAGGGASIERAPGWLQGAGAWLTDRWATMVAIWQYPVPVTPLEVFRSKDLQPGQVISLTVSTIIGRDGTRGIAAMDALVLSVGRQVTGVSRVATVALTGYTITPGLCRWAPSAVVVSVAGSTITVTMDNGQDVDDWFTAGDAVQILTSTGATRDATVTVSSSTSTTVTVTGMGVTPVAGDRVVLAPYTTAVYDEAGYFASGYRYV